ncbi:MAG: cobalamin-dependent protein, partial [Myxococcota bacterium]|nr:cobalamin-dependent protein [Myxococcota bacterium]
MEETLDRVPQRSGVLAFSAMFSSDWLVVRKLINEARKRFPEALFVAGGEHVTALGEYVLRDCPALDVCVRGEGERKFLDLLEAWTRDGDYSGVSGISYLDK